MERIEGGRGSRYKEGAGQPRAEKDRPDRNWDEQCVHAANCGWVEEELHAGVYRPEEQPPDGGGPDAAAGHGQPQPRVGTAGD